MKLKIKKIWKPILFTFLSAVFSFSVVFGGYKMFYAEAVDSFENSSYFFTAQNSYHNQMNNYFNDKFNKVSEVFGKNGMGIKDERLYPPTGCEKTSECADKCTEDNLSAFCVGMNALGVYQKYVIALSNMQNDIFMNQKQSVVQEYLQNRTDEQNKSSMTDLTQLIPGVISQNTDITDEVPAARKILEGTVNVYNEYIMSYPMHQKYQEIINSLTKYKTKLKTLKNEVKQFPGNFVDTTSTKCL